ncbi:MAG: EAL domain-containing protein, partial [Gammaproteobacteria bacterium]
KVRVFLDLYEQRIKFKQLNQRYQLIINAAGEGIFGIDLEANISFINPAAEKNLGYESGKLIGKSLNTLIEQPVAEVELETPEQWKVQDIFDTCSQHNTFHKDDATFKRNDETLLPIEFTAAPIYDQHEQYNGIVFVFSDITLRKTVEEQLTNLALYDHLTKLPNRLLFEKTMSQSLARARRNNKLMALMFLDLDHFKDINDRLGHDVGDLLLKGVSDRLITCIRETDTVARLGGDEFAIILDEISATEDAAMIAEKIIHSLTPPFYLNGNEVFISTSIGIAVYPISGETAIALTKNADIAMYQAKQTGRDQYCFFTDIMNEQIRFRLEMVHSLRYSIDRNELELYYQPKLDLNTRKITGTEALLRWNHPVLGLLKPADFIQVAEETGLIQKIGKWAIEEACRANKRWQDTGHTPCRVAVNLSSFQVVQDDIIEVIQDALTHSGLEPKYLEIELTETSLIANTEKSAKVLYKLHQIGVGITIDDFGTGYSSLYYLKKLPVDSLKIDQGFVRDITTDSNDAAIVKAVIGLAHNLELAVIAEGVEQPEQLKFLEEYACDQVQGFLFSNPLTEKEMAAFFEQHDVK